MPALLSSLKKQVTSEPLLGSESCVLHRQLSAKLMSFSRTASVCLQVACSAVDVCVFFLKVWVHWKLLIRITNTNCSSSRCSDTKFPDGSRWVCGVLRKSKTNIPCLNFHSIMPPGSRPSGCFAWWEFDGALRCNELLKTVQTRNARCGTNKLIRIQQPIAQKPLMDRKSSVIMHSEVLS